MLGSRNLLFGAAIPEHEVKVYEDKIRGGGILVAVIAHDSAEENKAKDILRDSNAQSIRAMAA